MQNPASPPKSRHICPACNSPVGPGNKFCKTCGMRIPELSTCSKCGTQFIAPVQHCDLCGAPVIPGKVPEPDDVPEYEEEENSGQAEDQASDQDDGEIPEPDSDELPEYPGEETIELVTDKAPHHHTREVREPDTDELLEQFGKEYDNDETLESWHTPKVRSPIEPEAKKPVGVPAPFGRASSETVDDVLFMSPKKPGAPAKSRGNRTRIIIGCIVLTALIASVYFIGLPALTGSGGLGAHRDPPAAEITPLATPVGTIPPAMTTTPVPVSRALAPLPTQLMPPGPDLYFQVQKNPVTARITIIFTGSAGQGSLSSADIRVTHPDGSIATGIIQPLKGVTEITLDGSKEADRVEILAKMSSGETYRVRDELVPLVGL
jgi:hypothetical protein